MSLEVKNLTFSFKKSYLFKKLNFQAEKNSINLVAGASGIGKSTLLNVISGLVKPETGLIKSDGHVLNDNKIFIQPENRNIGYVFQDFALFPHINAEKNIRYALSKDLDNSFNKTVTTLNLQDHLAKMPHELSGGQQQRVAIARSVLMKPSILLLDEPFSNLDNENTARAQTLITNVVSELNIPCILVTHDLACLKTIDIAQEIILN